ncbi:MAG: LamG domain-containing protein [Lacipirellulaceae bacterium]
MGIETKSGQGASASFTALVDYPFTIAGWFRVSGDNVITPLVSLENTTAGVYYDIFYAGQSSDRPIARTRSGGSSLAIAGAAMNPDQWHHVVGVFASANSRAVYLDGGNKGTNSSSHSFTAPTELVIGNYFHAGATDVAEAMIFDAALSDEEVAALASGLPVWSLPVARNLTAYYEFLSETRRPGLGPELSTSGTPTFVDHPKLLRAGSSGVALAPARQRGPFFKPAGEFHTLSSEVGSVAHAGVASISQTQLAAEVIS